MGIAVAALVEPFAVLDTLVSGLAKVDFLRGGNVRFTYFTENHLCDGTIEHIVACKLVVHLESIPDIKRTANEALARALSDGLQQAKATAAPH